MEIMLEKLKFVLMRIILSSNKLQKKYARKDKRDGLWKIH